MGKLRGVACLWAMLFALEAVAQQYKVTDLGALTGFTSSYADDNNNAGQVTGCSDNSTVPTVPCTANIAAEAFLWSNGDMQPLGYLSGDDQSVGYVVNDSGVVVGSSANTTAGTYRGFVWTNPGPMVALPDLPGGSGYTFATAITSKGVIVGESETSQGNEDIVLWTESQGSYEIHDEGCLPSAPYCYTDDINANLQVTGTAYFFNNNSKYHAFLWSNAKGWKDLGALQGGNSQGIWMTDSGLVAGTSTSAQYPNGVSVYWDTTGKIHNIGTLPGGNSSSPGYISDSGTILGQSTVSGGDTHAYMWTQKTGMRDLNNMIPPHSGWDLHHAASINNAGVIVGYGTINGVDHAFQLTPAAE
jgi:probable HAF family extracellular repeat protein